MRLGDSFRCAIAGYAVSFPVALAHALGYPRPSRFLDEHVRVPPPHTTLEPGRSAMLRKQFSINVNNICAIALLTFLLIAAAAQPAQAQTFTIVHAFASGTDGAVPNAIIRDAQGNLYGTTEFGGDVSCGDDTCGTVF